MDLNKKEGIAVYCGSNSGNDPAYSLAANQLAKDLIASGKRLIYGGAKVGLMGIVADTVLAHGGEVIGVIPESLIDKEIAHQELTQLHIVKTMHERKTRIAELANGFILLPGGAGSLDEFFEIFTWHQLGFHEKPVGILNVNRYFDSLIAFLDHSVNEGFLKGTHRDQIIIEQSSAKLLAGFANYIPRKIDKWL